ncbi:unnamed protein product [Parnassius apollo]|uniref:(apollo) hypothetical protein n=1 Tax=Parnassius apollo TaxID=110799 RepID=A0A8S3W1N9_PARAO|nr:unnamed protein product [Parnassius apollo]
MGRYELGSLGNVPEIRVLAEMLAVPINWETSAGYKTLLRTISLLHDNSFKQNLSANCKRRKDKGGRTSYIEGFTFRATTVG